MPRGTGRELRPSLERSRSKASRFWDNQRGKGQEQQPRYPLELELDCPRTIETVRLQQAVQKVGFPAIRDRDTLGSYTGVQHIRSVLVRRRVPTIAHDRNLGKQ